MFSRSSVGELRQGIREGKRMAILIKVTFIRIILSYNMARILLIYL